MRRLACLSILLLFAYCSSDSDSAEIVIPPILNYTLSVAAEEGGSVSSAGGSYKSGQVVTITATANSEYVFSGWSNGSNENPLTVTINSNQVISASFDKKKYALTISKVGEGSVTEELISSGRSTDYNSGSNVKLTAIPESGWFFSSWTGDFEGTDNPIEVNITEAKSITANFEQLNAVYLDDNGVTIKAYDFAVVGDVYELDGVSYKVVDNESLKSMVENNDDLTKVVTTKVTVVYQLFLNDTDFNQDIGSWDTSNIYDWTGMFYNASSFNQNLSSWDTSNASDMRGMFNGASEFNQDIAGWDTSNVTKMNDMFKGAISFNSDISLWNTAAVTNMKFMFERATAFNQDIGSWNTAAVTNMEGMFYGATSFNGNIGSWNTAAVTEMDFMFQGATVFNQDLTGWCVTNITFEPPVFAVSSNLTNANKPDWGACPTTISAKSYSIDVTANNSANYTLSGTDRNGNISGSDPSLTFNVGDTISFVVNASGHPFYLKTVAGTGTGNTISGLTNNGTQSATISWTPDSTGTFYYQCSLHAGMVGTITIQ